MRLQGLHHITMITADAQRNVGFYADVLGLRLVKKTVNFDQPDAYHLYFGDEKGTPGSILTWFEFPGAARGRAGAGMIHCINLGVSSESALAFWEQRLESKGYDSVREADSLRFDDYDGLAFRLVATHADAALRAEHPDVPAEHAITGVVGAQAYTAHTLVGQMNSLLVEALGFGYVSDGEYRLDGERRPFSYRYDPAPPEQGYQGAGTVHHIAWACRDEDQIDWQAALQAFNLHVTQVLDRDYFRSIYFREPRQVLFEIATLSPGFDVDEDPDHLGEELRLPHQHEHLRRQLQQILKPIHNPRATAG